MEHELRLLLKRPGNDLCADCEARYPRFASINLALFLCNRCYGVHRSIGTHVTRTKTVGLDRWSSEEVHRMSSIGNVVANAYWEENVPVTFKRPTADSPDFVVEKWIRDKYERKLFCSASKEPPSVSAQITELVTPNVPIKERSPQVKLLPRGALRCGPDCRVAIVSDESSSSTIRSNTSKQDKPNCQVSSPQTTDHTTNGLAQTLQNPVKLPPFTERAFRSSIAPKSENQLEQDNDNEDFGDFVQA